LRAPRNRSGPWRVLLATSSSTCRPVWRPPSGTTSEVGLLDRGTLGETMPDDPERTVPWPPMEGWDSAMGLRIVRASRDEVVAEYVVERRHHQPYGIVHGGVHCTAVETVCSTGAGLDAVARGQSVVGLENHTSFVRAVREGTVTIRATPV